MIRNDLAEQLVKTLNVPKINALRRGLVYSIVDTFNSKQKSITEKIKEIYGGEDIQTEYKVPGLKYRIDIYFHEYKLAVEVDEYGHCDRDIEYEEEEREIKIRERLDCKFIRINLDEKKINIFKAINKYADTLKNQLKN